MYSTVILTLNEERALPACLASLRNCDDVVILDSGSSDSTCSIASAAGARVFSRKFDDFSGQRNYAQLSIPFRHPWVLHLDADETMTEALDQECRSVVRRVDLDGFRIAPKMIFQGRWVRHCTDYPAYQARLVRAPQFRFIQAGHGQREEPGMRLENLRCSYLHDLSIYGIDAWIEKHRGYARAEAKAVLEDLGGLPWRMVLSPDALVRRRAIKRISFSLPFRPTARFVYQYLLRRGFMDGRQGLCYCLLLAKYEGFIKTEIAHMRLTYLNRR